MLLVSELVCLTAGPAVPLAALQLLWDLESRGLDVAMDGEALAISPAAALSEEDRAAITRHRDELVALVRHCEARQ